MEKSPFAEERDRSLKFIGSIGEEVPRLQGLAEFYRIDRDAWRDLYRRQRGGEAYRELQEEVVALRNKTRARPGNCDNRAHGNAGAELPLTTPNQPMTDQIINIHDHGFVRLIDTMGTDVRIVEAARLSYRSPSKGEEADKKLLRYLFKNKHTSPFEMCKITFNIKMPIFVMRQFVRHRMQNLNEVSARYTELPSEFYLPEQWRVQDTKNKQSSMTASDVEEDWHIRQSKHAERIYDLAYQTYQTMLKEGVAREMARIVLPVGIYTEIYSAWDLSNLLKFFALRDDSHAQAEIQDYARAMKSFTAERFPWVMEVYEESRNAG